MRLVIELEYFEGFWLVLKKIILFLHCEIFEFPSFFWVWQLGSLPFAIAELFAIAGLSAIGNVYASMYVNLSES